MARTKITGIQLQGVDVKRQDDTTNTTLSNARMEIGWGAMTFNSTSATNNEAVTFQTAFTVPPIVVITFGGDHGNGTAIAYGNGNNTIHMQSAAKAVAITTTGFMAYCYHASSGQYSSGDRVYYQWIAIGV